MAYFMFFIAGSFFVCVGIVGLYDAQLSMIILVFARFCGLYFGIHDSIYIRNNRLYVINTGIGFTRRYYFKCKINSLDMEK